MCDRPYLDDFCTATSKIDHFTSASANDFIFGLHGDGEDWFLNACFFESCGRNCFRPRSGQLTQVFIPYLSFSVT